jgi:hypothetical protein
MLPTAAVAAALCSVAVAASTAGVAVHSPEGFGPHGRLATIGGLAWPSGRERAAVTGDGRVYVAATPGPGGPVRVRRYLPDGEPDRSFGIAGAVVALDLGGGFALDELLVDTNGLAYFVGTTGDDELVVARLGPSGAPDPSYGDGGVGHLGPVPITAGRPRATIDQENRVIVAAAAAVHRLAPNGELDPIFGTEGTEPLPASEVEGLGVDEEGQVQLALPGEDGRGFRLLRLNRGGRPSRTLDPTGMHAFIGIGRARAMAVGYDGSTLVVGTATKRTGDGVTAPVLWIAPRAVRGESERSSAHLRGSGRVADVLSDASDDYLIGDREVIDLDIHPDASFSPGDTYDHFGRDGRVTMRSPGGLTALGATITDAGGTLLIDGIARPRGGGAAHGFLAKFPAAEHVITYAPEPMGG